MKYVVTALYQKGNGIDQSSAEVEDLEKGIELLRELYQKPSVLSVAIGRRVGA